MVAGAEVAGDDQLVAELARGAPEVVEVHVAELVDLVLAVAAGRRRSISMISTSASNMAGQASSPSGELSPR